MENIFQFLFQIRTVGETGTLWFCMSQGWEGVVVVATVVATVVLR